MKKKSIIKIVFLLPIITIHFNTSPIQNITAQGGTFLMGCLCAVGNYEIIKKFPGKIHPAVLVGVSCIATVATYYILEQATPIGRLKRANQILNDLSRHTLVSTPFNNDQIFFDTVQDVYIADDLPLISAYNHLIALLPLVRFAFSLINKASAEVGKDVLLQEECDASLSRANTLFNNISQAIKRIRSNKDYLPQLTIYKENLLYEKQTIAQEQMALAQLQSAHAQQGNLLLKFWKTVVG